MTKEITKARVLQEVQDKFKLREFDSAQFLFDETVVPTYDIGQHLKSFQNRWAEKSITGIGAQVFFTVPFTEKWKLYRYDVVFMGAGAYTVAGVLTMRVPITSGESCYLDLKAAQTESYHIQLPTPIVLHPGDKLYINIDGYTSTQDLRLYIDHEVEEIR